MTMAYKAHSAPNIYHAHFANFFGDLHHILYKLERLNWPLKSHSLYDRKILLAFKLLRLCSTILN